MAVPKRKTSKSKRDKRRTHQKISALIYRRVLIAVKPRFRIMPVPVAVLTKAAPSFQQTRINLHARMLIV